MHGGLLSSRYRFTMLQTSLLLVVVVMSTWVPVLCVFQLSESPTDLVVSITGEVFVGAGSRVYRLNGDLSLNASILISGRGARVQKMALSLNESKIALCLSDGSCLVYDSDFMGSPFEESTSVGVVVIPGSSIALLIAPSMYGDTFYVGSRGRESASDLDIILLGQYGLSHSETFRSSETDFTVYSDNFQRDFIGSFQYNSFVYYVVVDNGTESSGHNIRILRVCDDPNDNRFSALYEAILDCGTLSQETKISSFSSVDTFGGATEFTGVIGITGGGQSRVCSFHVADVDKEMLKTFEECADGTADIPLAWNTLPFLGSCSEFMEPSATECNFGAGNTFTFVTALATFRAVSGTTVINLGDVEITATLSLEIDSISLMYIGYSNDTGCFLEQYYVTDKSSVLPVSTEATLAPVIFLRWIPNLNFVYAATAEEVYRIPFQNCSVHSNCTSCASDDPLCGWCVLEHKCSRKMSCKYSELKGRWVQESSQCITSTQLFDDITSVDSIQQGLQLEVSVLPHLASLPKLKENSSYYCLFSADDQYSFSAPFSGSVCAISPSIPWFSGIQIVVDFTIITTEEEIVFSSIKEALTLYNCSIIESCGQCVQVSTVCGWCIYNQTCTGANSLCRAVEDWIRTEPVSESGSSGSYTDICPMVLAPTRGHYVHPVIVARILTIHTINMPPPISGFKYECVVEHKDGTLLRLPVDFADDNEEPIKCQASINQIRLSPLSVGEERVEFSLLWVSEDGQYQYHFEYVNSTVEDLHRTLPRMPHIPPPLPPPSPPPDMILYDCSQLAGCCSSCVATTIQTGYECGWCSGMNACSIVEECIGTATQIAWFAARSIDCPLPVITSVVLVNLPNSHNKGTLSEEYTLCSDNSISPISGPTIGGTTVTLTGRDLGVMVEDVIEVSFGDSLCGVDENSYTPGTTIVCNTTQSDAIGAVNVTVRIQRGVDIVSTNSSLNPTFTYAVPSLMSVFPLYGPKSGGTVITIKGAALNISNSTETKVKLAGVYCIIRFITYTDIVCITQRRHKGAGLVQITIGAATLFGDGMQYIYTDDPVFYSIHPTNTIPGGGVTLTFSGKYLNVVQHPLLVITGEMFNSIGFCRAFNDTTLHCIAPRIPDPFNSKRAAELVTRQEGITLPLNYTVLMDDAAGPSSDVLELQLTVKPNPALLHINGEDIEYTYGSGRTIRIVGVHLESVSNSELQVIVNGAEECQIISNTDEEIQCSPPDLQLLADGNVGVVVLIANGSLEFDVGYLHYKSVNGSGSMTPMSTDTLLIKKIVPIVATVVCVLLLGVGAIITVAFYRVRKTKRTHSRRILESPSACTIDGKQIRLKSVTNVYHGSPFDGPEENVYDVIPDYIIGSTQVNQPENFRENIYDNEKDPVASLTLEQVDGETTLHPRRRALPPTPSCSDDEYVEMRPHSVSSCMSVSVLPVNFEYERNSQLQLHQQLSSNSEYVERLPTDEGVNETEVDLKN